MADTHHSTEEAAAGALSRARASLRGKAHPSVPATQRAAAPSRRHWPRRLAGAFSAYDVDTVVSLLAEDVRITMPPLPAVWEGRESAAGFLAEVAFRLVPGARFAETRANRQPALAVCTRDDTNGLWRGSGLLVITVRGDQVVSLTRFESHTLRASGLPRSLPGDDPVSERGR